MKYLNIFALAIVSLFMINCTSNDKSTIILLGTESYVQDIKKIIPDSLQGKFNKYGMIHSGYVPPKIEGNFVVSKKERVASNVNPWPLDVVEPDIYLKISDQHNRVARLVFTEATSTETDTVYISGSDKKFTMYYIENKKMTYLGATSLIKRAMLFSGEVSDLGIKDLYTASIILDVIDNSGGVITQYKKGDYFIYKDADGLANKRNN